MKPDYLRECMSDVPRAPIDEFNARYCVICANRDCLRAGALNRLSFDKRVQSWRKDLFDEVPRAAEDDPRFAGHRSKRFIVLQSADAPSVTGSWSRPAEAVAPAQPQPAEAPVAIHATPDAPAPVDEPTAVPAADPVRAAPRQPGNTPFVQGAFIGRPPAKEPDAGEIGNGGTFTFGGSDE
jgi:hypothetical protein